MKIMIFSEIRTFESNAKSLFINTFRIDDDAEDDQIRIYGAAIACLAWVAVKKISVFRILWRVAAT